MTADPKRSATHGSEASRRPIRAGVGLSREVDTASAAREAVRSALSQAGLKRADWALCILSGDHVAQAEILHRTVVEESGCTELGGCSASGVIAEDEEVEGSSAVAVMVGDTECLNLCSGIVTANGAGLARLGDFMAASEDPGLMLLWPDTYATDGAALLKQCAEILPDVPVYGAGATDGGQFGMSVQLAREGVHTGGASAVAFRGNFDVAVGITQSCAPVGDPHFITEAKDQILIGLDGRPALSAYIDQGKAMDMDTLQQVAEELLFGFPLDPENPEFTGESSLVRALGGFDQPSHGLVVPYRMQENTTMGFMHRHPDVADTDMARMVGDVARKLPGPPDLALYFDCAARGRGFYNRPNVDLDHIRAVLGDVPLLGMFGGFEVATAHGKPNLYTFTGVLVLLRAR